MRLSIPVWVVLIVRSHVWLYEGAEGGSWLEDLRAMEEEEEESSESASPPPPSKTPSTAPTPVRAVSSSSASSSASLTSKASSVGHSMHKVVAVSATPSRPASARRSPVSSECLCGRWQVLTSPSSDFEASPTPRSAGPHLQLPRRKQKINGLRSRRRYVKDMPGSARKQNSLSQM